MKVLPVTPNVLRTHKLLIAVAMFAAAATCAQAKPLPPCDDAGVQKVMVRLVNAVRNSFDVSEMGSEPDTNTKRMCYVYFFGQTGRIRSAYQEAIFSLDFSVTSPSPAS